MAIDFASMLLEPTKATPWNLPSGGDSSAREQLKLARERFEEEKRENARQREWAKTEEAGRNARAAMERQEALRKEEAARQATLLAQQQGGVQKFGELAGSGKVQQAEAMLPYLDQLGYDVNTLGNVGGLPVFQMQNRAQEAQKASEEFERGPRAIEGWDGEENATQSLTRMDGLGYPANERGTLEEAPPPRETAETGEVDFEPGGSLDEATTDALTPGDADLATAGQYGADDDATVSVGRGMTPGSLSTGDAYAQALAASQYARDNKAPRRGPDEEDFQGAVPRNVIDLPAMAAETTARLSPMLKSIAGSLPTRELRDTAEAVGKGAAGLGLESTDALGEFKKGIDPALDIYKSEQNIAAAKAKEDRLTPVQEEQLKGEGIKRGDMAFTNAKLAATIGSLQAGDTVATLMKGGKRNHEKAVNFLMKMTVNSGPQTEADALRVIGRGKLDSIEQLQDWLHERVVGGFSDEEIASINEFVEMQRASDRKKVFGWLAANDQQMRNPKTHELTRAGYEEFRNGGSIPPELLDEYEERAKKAEAEGGGSPGQSAPQSSGEAGAELQRQAEKAGLNGQVLGRLMAGESGGKTSAANEDRTDGAPKSSAKGVFQLIDSTAQLMGFKDAAEYAAQPLEKQISVGLDLFKNKGITAESPPEDYALVLAAPSFVGKWKSRDDVVYKKDSDEWKGNAPWRPAGGGDITVGSIADYYMGKGGKAAEAKTDAKPAEAKPGGAPPEPQTAAQKRIVELLKKKAG